MPTASSLTCWVRFRRVAGDFVRAVDGAVEVDDETESVTAVA
jgi:hypothetical protein